MNIGTKEWFLCPYFEFILLLLKSIELFESCKPFYLTLSYFLKDNNYIIIITIFSHRDLEGKFDAIWDRGSLVALNRQDVPA